MSDVEIRFHESWLGMVQPVEGLVVSIPSLVDAQCWSRLPLEARDVLAGCCVTAPTPDTDAETVRADLRAVLFNEDLLGFRAEDLDGHGLDGHDLGKGALPDDLMLWVPEGRQEIRPTAAVRRKKRRELDPQAGPAARAGADYDLLIWRLPAGLALDRNETETGPWEYPAAAKFDRLLRHCRVPVGLLWNGDVARLVYAPHGETSGSLTFRFADMVTVGGRDILDAFVMLLSRRSFFTRPPESRLPALLEDSRKRQADVTDELASQVFEALSRLLEGFETAAERDGHEALFAALAKDDDHVYGGLLTVLLRLVFCLYAEDRGLLPVDKELYAEFYSVLGLFDQLQRDAGEFPDSMDRRFGAWDRLLALFRLIWLGNDDAAMPLPARRGKLFDPHEYPFLEGRLDGSAPIWDSEAQAAMTVPSVDDGCLFEVLRRLVILQGQRLSYRTLDVEQIGSVYEALMGYHVVRFESPAVCLRPTRCWVEVGALCRMSANRRAAWLQSEAGLARALAKKVAQALADAIKQTDDAPVAALETLKAFRQKGTDVLPAGRLALQPGVERRRTSSHYTPRSFSGPIVKRTLEPLLATLGPEPDSEHLLQLKICDPAMGSGAFLVETCRYLADRLVEAWTREGRMELVASTGEDVVNHARRLVAQRCLYGVDKNRFAVDLAKLSLWLETLAADLPFTFLDHALRWGDSLVGLDFRQIRGFHWQPEAQETLASQALKEALDEVVDLRRQILDLAGEGPEMQPKKELLLRDADDAVAHARLLGDLVVGAFFAHPKKKAREQELARRLTLVNAWLQDGGEPPTELWTLRDEIHQQTPVFHWMLEFPEIFYADRPDPLDGDRVNQAAFIDAFVGNPPFAGKNQINESSGPYFLHWMKEVFPGSHGNADLSAYFFRQADILLGSHGTLGLIATNTIAQGDTRATGLQALLDRPKPATLYDATPTMPWPGAAAVTVSVVHLAKGTPSQGIVRRLDGEPVAVINSRLLPKPERPDPVKLIRNRELSFQGTTVLGMGFTLTPEERQELIDKDPRNGERIFPYLGGDEVNSSPTQTHHRHVISFGQMDLDQTEAWPDLIEIVRQKVKPERDGNKRANYKKLWWVFGEARPGLYEAIALLDRCLVTSRHSKHLLFSFQPTGRIFSEATNVFALQSHSSFAVLQSRIHEAWARLLSSSLEDRLRYAASDCFETFPFPQPDPRT